jgi:hypothetical protein
MVVIGGADVKNNKNSMHTKSSGQGSVQDTKKTQDNQTVQEQVSLPDVSREMIIAQSN